MSRRNDNDDDARRITVTTAKSIYKVTEADLKDIDCKNAPNPHYKSASPMRLYRLSDIQAISDKKKEYEKQLQEEVNDRLYEERVGLLAAKDIQVDDISEPFYDYVLGDYLTNKKSKITITSIKRHYTSVVLIKQLEEKWHLPELIPYFYKYKGGTARMPITMMMVVEKALRISDKIMKVISNNLLAYKIGSYLDTNALSNFKSYLERFDLDLQQPSDYIQSEILSSLSNPRLANDNIVQKYISFAVSNPNLLGFTINNIKEHLENNSETARDIALRSALKQYSLDRVVHQNDNVVDDDDDDDDNDGYSANDDAQLRLTQKSTKESFLSTGYPSIGEIVAKVRLNDYLYSFPNGFEVYNKNTHEFQKLLYQYITDGLSIMEATEKLLKRKPKQPRRLRRRHNYGNHYHGNHHFF